MQERDARLLDTLDALLGRLEVSGQREYARPRRARVEFLRGEVQRWGRLSTALVREVLKETAAAEGMLAELGGAVE